MNWKVFGFCWAIVICMSSVAVAGQWGKSSDSTMTTKMGFLVPSSTIELKSPSSLGSNSIRLSPHANTKTFLGFGYRNLGLTVSAVNPNKDEDDKNKGVSRSTDVQLRFYGKNTYELTYQSYHGFFIENSEEIDPSYNTDLKIQRPDLSSRTLGFSYLRNLDESDYSLAVIFDHSGRQTESGWGRLLMISARESQVTSQSALVPSMSQARFGDVGDIKGWQAESLTVGAGLGGVATFQSFYLSGLFGLGLGYYHNNVDFELRRDKAYETLGVTSTVRFGLGYNGQSHVWGAQYLNTGVSSEVEEGTINLATHEVSVFYAYRFDQVNLGPLNTVSAWFD